MRVEQSRLTLADRHGARGSIEAEHVETVGGLLAYALGRVPIAGSVATVAGLTLTADSLAGRRNRIETAYFDGKVSEDAYQRNLRRVEEEIAAVGIAREQLAVSEEKLRALLASSG